ncbi:MAG: hypothetical protein OHK0024_21740 [Thalassobaculales bacterium]
MEAAAVPPPAARPRAAPRLGSVAAEGRREPVPVEQIPGDPLAVAFGQENDITVVRFPWQEATASVVFRRGDTLWIGFDAARRLDLSAAAATGRPVFGTPQQVASPHGTVLRLPLLPGISPRVIRDGLAWVLELKPQGSRPDVPLAVEVQPISPQGPRVFVPVTGIAEPIYLTDPDIGDNFYLIPVAPIGRGVEGDRDYAQFSLPSTVQGVVVVPLADDVRVRILPDGVAVTGGGDGLFLSLDAQRADTFGEAQAGAPDFRRGRLFDMSAWRRGTEGRFRQNRQDLQRRLVDSTGLSRSKPRLDLAQFFFAHGLAAEALGIMQLIAADDPDYANRPEARALRGAARFLMARYDEALEDLGDRALRGNREAELWQGAARAAQGEWTRAVEHFARAGEIPGDYPRNYMTEIALLAAEAAIKVGDNRGAGSFLDVVASGAPTNSEMARIDYLRGRVQFASGNVEGAFETWQRLVDGTDRWARVRAGRALVDEKLKRQEMTRAEAIRELDRLRFAWRGDALEFELLRDLGRLYLQEGDFRNGLTVLRQAVTSFPDMPASRELAQEMSNAFASLYLDGAADRLPPLTALALYDDFRELTPAGGRGNEMIRRLADRLVGVDLLDRAATLLERQVKFRLTGLDKARVGAQLAVVRLLDRRPEAAITALDDSAERGLPPELVAERNRLRARAQFDLGQSQPALTLLRPDTSREADLLRAEIYWREQNWREVAAVFGRLVGDMPADRLDERQAMLVLNWTIGLSLSNNGAGLTQVRQRYGTAMDETPFREAFRLIANAGVGETADFRTLSQRFQEIERFQAFMTSYRDRLRNAQLSQLN